MWKIKKCVKHLLSDYENLNVEEVLKKAKSKEIISFDIFDTLLKRSVSKPTDIFKLIELNEKIPNFQQRRIWAEKKARQESKYEEVTLDEIYKYFPGNEDKKKLRKIEVKYERNLSVTNFRIKKLYSDCLKYTKIVLITDMYLPRKVIEDLLAKNGITNYYKLYISNEVRKTKINTNLFDFVLKDLQINSSQLLHIGNSFKADYLSPRKLKINSMKVPTYKNNMQRKYRNVLNADEFKLKTLNSFINTHERKVNTYYDFGYEVFGPLLFGFITWLFNKMRKQNIEQVYFLSRDGYIMKRLYDQLGFYKIIPSEYFEVSRRSLRVPNYNKNQTYMDIINSLTVPNMTNLIQVFDTLGLDIDLYKEEINKVGLKISQPLKRDKLVENKRFYQLFKYIQNDIFKNANKERKNLLKYLDQYNFNKKTALVDIGWAGSMQMYLNKSLKELGITPNIIGYYIGLTLKSRENLENNNLTAYGYTFDCLNNTNDKELESSFIGLIESLFLEQHGSVKKYKESNGGNFYAERYPYEYLDSKGHKMLEAKYVYQVQTGALKFAEDISKEKEIIKLIRSDHKVMFNNLYSVGTDPKKINLSQFGWFTFFNDGSKVYLAKPLKYRYYFRNPRKLRIDLYNSQWKIGFLKALFKIDLPYLRIFKFLRRRAN
ncbi:hypothetical protein IMAU30046_01721 [Lactobacillus helveticus]|uniref:hypothetical protein n=1 Tax=Lactobacillus helveticus TaxID=1587 RepID=UPI001562A7B5|nr:hypothetical protein [Lactobacillus helveticus]NRO13044.1 hypothetical protein [Lactobacillus helveticus]